MRIVRELDEASWQEFVDLNDDGNIFHTPEMWHTFSRADGYKPALWAAVDSNEKILALLLPVEITVLDKPILRNLTTRAVVYGSILCDPTEQGHQALDLLLKSYNQQSNNQLLFTELRNSADMAAFQPTFDENGLAHEGHLNFLIDLTRPQSEIWKAIRSNARRNVRKAQKSGVTLNAVTDMAGVANSYAILQKVYKRIQVPLPDYSLFEAAFEILYPRGMFEIYLASVDGEDIGALTLLLHKGVILYWYTGTLREFSSYRASDLLVWHVLEMGSEKGYRTFDFGGGGEPDQEYGVRDFKAKFGGTLVNYGRNKKIHAPLRLQASEFGYRMLRRFL